MVAFLKRKMDSVGSYTLGYTVKFKGDALWDQWYTWMHRQVGDWGRYSTRRLFLRVWGSGLLKWKRLGSDLRVLERLRKRNLKTIWNIQLTNYIIFFWIFTNCEKSLEPIVYWPCLKAGLWCVWFRQEGLEADSRCRSRSPIDYWKSTAGGIERGIVFPTLSYSRNKRPFPETKKNPKY